MDNIVHHRKALPLLALEFSTGLDTNGNRLEITKLVSTEDGSFVAFTDNLSEYLKGEPFSMNEKLTIIVRRQRIRINRRDFRAMLKFKA